jgi:hypothetical protein
MILLSLRMLLHKTKISLLFYLLNKSSLQVEQWKPAVLFKNRIQAHPFRHYQVDE